MSTDREDPRELLYKGYKAYVPPRWSSFEKGGTLSKQERSFKHFLHGGAMRVEPEDPTAQLPSGPGDREHPGMNAKAVQQPTGSKVDPSLLPKKKQNWTKEMAAYVKEQEMKEKAKLRRQELQGDLRTMKDAEVKRREKAVEVPAMAQISATSSFMSQKVHDEGKALRHSFLLRAAVEANHSHNREIVEEHFAEKQSKKRQALMNHVDKVNRIGRDRAEAMRQRSQDIHQDLANRHGTANNHRESQDEAKQKQREEEHKRALELEHQSQIQREQDAEDRRERIVSHNSRHRARVAHAKAMNDAERARFEKELEESFAEASERVLMMDAHRMQRVDEGLIEKAQARAKANRDAARQKQLAACAAKAKERQHRLDMHDQYVKDFVADVNGKNKERLSRSDQVRDQQWRDRSRAIDESIEYHHRRTPKPDEPEFSRTLQDLYEHNERKREVDAANERRRQDLEDHQWEMEERAQHRQNKEDKEAKQRFQDSERHRRETRGKGEDRKQAKEDRTMADHIRRRQRSDDHLAEFREDRATYHRNKLDEKAARTREALELVNVTKREQLIDDIKEKERMHNELRNVGEEIRGAKRKADRDSYLHRLNETKRRIRKDERDRDVSNRQNLAAYEEKISRVKTMKDDNLESIRKREHNRNQYNLNATNEAAEQRERDFLKKRKDLEQREARWAEQRSLDEADAADERRRKAKELKDRIDGNQDRAYAQSKDKAARTISRLEMAYQRGPGSERHPDTTVFGNAYSAERVRSAFS